MKKVTFFVCDIYQMGGIEKVVTLIANELSKKYEVEIISLYQTSENPFYNLNKKIKIINILKEQLEPIKLYYPYLNYIVRRKLKSYETDVFICAGMGYVGLSISMRKKAKYIAWEHSQCLTGKVGGIMWLGRKLAAKHADKIVVLTKKDMKNNIAKFGTQDKICQIYNPIENNQINSKEYNINSKKIITCGRIAHQKGFDILVDVAEKVFDRYPNWEWHIYGDGEDRKMLVDTIKSKKLEKNLILKGTSNNLSQLYNEYAMYVMTSRHEGFPMVNIEAHNAKLPIISFDCPCGPDELIQDGVNGFIIENFNVDKMAEKIGFLIENKEIRKQMSDSTQLDKEKLKMEKIMEKWDNILE